MRNGVLAVLLLLAAGEALLALAACTGTEGERCIMPDSTMRECREGDIVLRKGTGMTSRIVCAAEGSEDYSHCGIVARAADGRLVVVHAVPDEPDFEGDPDRVKSEPIESFFSHIKAQRGRILRLAADRGCVKTHPLIKITKP